MFTVIESDFVLRYVKVKINCFFWKVDWEGQKVLRDGPTQWCFSLSIQVVGKKKFLKGKNPLRNLLSFTES